MTDPLFFGYFTTGTPYETEARTIRASLDGLGLAHEFVGIANRGDWQKNTQAKGDVVADFLRRYPGRRLVYVDVDAVVLSRPELFWTTEADVAATIFNGNEFLSGTVFFRSNPRTVALVDRWRELNRMNPEFLPDGRAAWDQRTLHLAVKERVAAGTLTFEELPQAYTYIVELSQRMYPGVAPIILHTRGSLRHGEKMGRVR